MMSLYIYLQPYFLVLGDFFTIPLESLFLQSLPRVQEVWAKYECFQTFCDDVFSRALACAKRVQRSTMGKTNWKPMKARKFGYGVKYA